jgi:hypothetical protein
MKSKNCSVYEKCVEKYLVNKGIEFETQFKYIPKRRFAADFYIPSKHALVEVNGGVYQGWGHGGGDALMKDYDKWTRASLLGYKIVLLGTGIFKKGRYYPEDAECSVIKMTPEFKRSATNTYEQYCWIENTELLELLIKV